MCAMLREETIVIVTLTGIGNHWTRILKQYVYVTSTTDRRRLELTQGATTMPTVLIRSLS